MKNSDFIITGFQKYVGLKNSAFFPISRSNFEFVRDTEILTGIGYMGVYYTFVMILVTSE